MGKVEILAPAGNMDCFRAAIKADSDAVYMAGKQFGARAYAGNFTTEEFIEALNIAHLHDKKIYLTMNTIVKEQEFGAVYGFLRPLYEEGLDGIIIQDIGLLKYIREEFPLLPLHASTQMTITGSEGALWAKSMGVCRVVPARELSLKELSRIKADTGLEIEAFVHGAMCYCYSGQCLYSSFLGGRSGNRGKCAGTCRLPAFAYDVRTGLKGVKSKKEEYDLSLKDLCTIEHVGELIEADIDSFKIEGRMKSPEYVAGVTYLYKKYSDLYLSGKDSTVTEEDKWLLSNLYLRSSVGTGYYYTHNSADMVTVKDSSYNCKSGEAEKYVRDNILSKDRLRYVNMIADISVGSNLSLSIYDEEGICASVTGGIVEEAQNAAVSEEELRKRLSKLGGTGLAIGDVAVNISGNPFIPVSTLNELRRKAVSLYIEEATGKYKRKESENIRLVKNSDTCTSISNSSIGVSILTRNQLDIIKLYSFDKLYIPFDLIYKGDISDDELHELSRNYSIYVSLPRIIRLRDKEYIEYFSDFARRCDCITGVLISNVDGLNLVKGLQLKIEADSFLYASNIQAIEVLKSLGVKPTAGLELSYYEILDLKTNNMVIPIYGYTPLMVSAGCVAKLKGGCNMKRYGFDYDIKDRYNDSKHVFINCLHCMNVMYNSVPTSYHKRLENFKNLGYDLRIDLTLEGRDKCILVLDYFLKGIGDAPAGDYTAGHLKKGAE